MPFIIKNLFMIKTEYQEYNKSKYFIKTIILQSNGFFSCFWTIPVAVIDIIFSTGNIYSVIGSFMVIQR